MAGRPSFATRYHLRPRSRCRHPRGPARDGPLASGEPGSERRENLIDELLAIPVLLGHGGTTLNHYRMSAANRLVIVPVPACHAPKAARTAARLASVAACAPLAPGICGAPQAEQGGGRSAPEPRRTCRLLASCRKGSRRRTGRAGQASTPDDSAPHDLWCRTNRRPEPNDQASTSESSIRLPNGSAKKASFRLIAGTTHGSATILTPRARSWASVSSTLATRRQKWW